MDELMIIKFLDGEMSGEERKNFEEEIRMNPTLADEVEKFRQIQTLAQKLLAGHAGEGEDLDLAVEEDLDPAVEEEITRSVQEFKDDPDSSGIVPPEYKERLKKAERSYMENREKSGALRMVRRIWYSAAAVVVIALIVSILVFSPFSRFSGNEIYAQYFRSFHKTEEIHELARTDNDFLFATEVYEAGDFERAVVLFEMLADSSELRAWSMFYAGSSYMSLNQTDKATVFLLILQEEEEEEVRPMARWQLTLCYIRNGRPELAREQLEMLRDDPAFRRDARRILRILQ